MSNEVDRLTVLLAAREAECAELRAAGGALQQEIDGIPNEGFDHMRAGRIQSKTFALLTALSRPPGTDAALRAMLTQAWEAGYLRGCGGCNPADGPPWDEDDCRNRDVAVARLLPAPQAQGEVQP